MADAGRRAPRPPQRQHGPRRQPLRRRAAAPGDVGAGDVRAGRLRPHPDGHVVPLARRHPLLQQAAGGSGSSAAASARPSRPARRTWSGWRSWWAAVAWPSLARLRPVTTAARCWARLPADREQDSRPGCRRDSPTATSARLPAARARRGLARARQPRRPHSGRARPALQATRRPSVQAVLLPPTPPTRPAATARHPATPLLRARARERAIRVAARGGEGPAFGERIAPRSGRSPVRAVVRSVSLSVILPVSPSVRRSVSSLAAVPLRGQAA